MRPWASAVTLRRYWLDLAVLGSLLVAAGFLRWVRFGLLDIFEDGYHHWWIGAHLLETSVYLDPMSKMTDGGWLPGYYPVVAAAHLVAGWDGLTLLRVVSLVSSLATLCLVYRITRPSGRVAAAFSGLFFGLAIQDTLIGSMATPEALEVFLVTAASFLLLHSRAGDERARRSAASLLFLAATTLRYEAWLAAGILAVHAWFRGRSEFRTRFFVVAPAIAFAAAWSLALVPQGGPVSIVFGQTAREAQNQIVLGNLPETPWGRWWFFWFNNYAIGLLPLFLLGPGYMILRERRSYGTWLAVTLFVGASVLVAAGVGTGSYRYVAMAVPFVSIAAGRGTAALLRRIPRPSPQIAARATATAVAFVVVACIANTAWITPLLDGVGLLQDPLRRAGTWISDQPWPAGKRLLSDSPVATYYSRVDPAAAWSSWWLPANRSEALALLRAHYAFIVFVNVSYYPLVSLFPELGQGQSTTDFVLVYDPNGSELQYGAKQVFVYAVRP